MDFAKDEAVFMKDRQRRNVEGKANFGNRHRIQSTETKNGKGRSGGWNMGNARGDSGKGTKPPPGHSCATKKGEIGSYPRGDRGVAVYAHFPLILGCVVKPYIP